MKPHKFTGGGIIHIHRHTGQPLFQWHEAGRRHWAPVIDRPERFFAGQRVNASVRGGVAVRCEPRITEGPYCRIFRD
jgi:hypothetical protein